MGIPTKVEREIKDFVAIATATYVDALATTGTEPVMTLKQAVDIVNGTPDPMQDPVLVSSALGTIALHAWKALETISETAREHETTARDAFSRLGFDETTGTWKRDATASWELRRAAKTLKIIGEDALGLVVRVLKHAEDEGDGP